jgi:hypothetical protein
MTTDCSERTNARNYKDFRDRQRINDVIRRINNAPISSLELRDYFQTCRLMRLPGDGYHNFCMQIATAGEHANHEPIRTLALYYRARAMALLVTRNSGMPSWTFSSSDETRFANDTLFAAAAAERMSVDDAGEFVFDRVTFLKRVFELAQPGVSAQ